MSKHTPGPWEAELGRDGAFSIESYKGGITSGLLVLASRNQHPLLAEQMHANARLIAAAPDLLEALQMGYAETMDYIRLNNLGAENNQWLVMARAAIRKATGEQQ